MKPGYYKTIQEEDKIVFPDFFHIGVPKSGTTTIQTVLERDPRLNRILSNYFHLVSSSPIYGYCKENVINIESDETIVRQGGKYLPFPETVLRIYQRKPAAHIIVTLREQRAMLASRYKYAVQKGARFLSFTQWLDSEVGLDFVRICDYASIFKTINKYFPAEQIHFLLFEEMVQDFQQFFSTIYAILGLKMPGQIDPIIVNKSITDQQIGVIENINNYPLFRKRIKPFKFEASLKRISAIFFSRHYKEQCRSWQGKTEEFESYFAMSNQELVRLGLFKDSVLKQHNYLL